MKNNRVFFKIILFLVLTIPVYAADTWTRAVDTYSRFDGLKTIQHDNILGNLRRPRQP